MNPPKVSDIVGIINRFAPFATAEEWDNVGLQVGDPAAPAGRIMVALDPGPEAIRAAIDADCQLLLTHHPFIFSPLKRVVASDPTGALIAVAIRRGLSILALHTNLDIATGGVNDLLAERLELTGCEPLKVSGSEELVKLAVFVPLGHEEKLLDALSRYSGFIGNYSDCSFRAPGIGTFRPLEGANPFIGEKGRREQVEEVRMELLLRSADLTPALAAMRKAHPYEEPAYDLYPLLNRGASRGLGRLGLLPEATTLDGFAATVKERLAAPSIRFVGDGGRTVRKVAVCGGSGASLLREARFRGADVLVTGDVKYHDAREAEATGLAIVDAGHFATERLMVTGVATRLRTELEQRKLAATVLSCEGEREPFTYI